MVVKFIVVIHFTAYGFKLELGMKNLMMHGYAQKCKVNIVSHTVTALVGTSVKIVMKTHKISVLIMGDNGTNYYEQEDSSTNKRNDTKAMDITIPQ
jgi:hypothetical protein